MYLGAGVMAGGLSSGAGVTGWSEASRGQCGRGCRLGEDWPKFGQTGDWVSGVELAAMAAGTRAAAGKFRCLEGSWFDFLKTED